jgi:subtilisin-like proprotein convertase family protein
MGSPKHLGFADDIDTDATTPFVTLFGPAATSWRAVDESATVTAMAETTSVTVAKTVSVGVPYGINEPQLDGYTYGRTTVYGSNITAAWRYSTGNGVTVGFLDDGFDPATTATYANFSTALSKEFGGTTTSLAEPPGGYHGTTTVGLIGATGANRTPEGLAPNAILVGAKVTFATVTPATLAQAEQYLGSVSGVVNNSWGYTSYGIGEANNPVYGAWYSTIQLLVALGRGALGDVITFAAGNDRLANSNLDVQPIVADYRVIAVAATDANGTVGYYSTPGAALLVATIGDNIAVANTGGSGSTIQSGTSYSSPTVAAIAAMMLSLNPKLGWRDVQEILADSSYMPPPSASSFTYNGDSAWNGGGMHFSNDLGYGVVDANVAANLARAWTLQSTSSNLDVATVTHTAAFSVGENASVSSTVLDSANIRVQHVEITINDTYLPVAWSKIVLISPDKTQSVLLNQTGLVSGVDQTGGLDISGSVMTSNAFWGENAVGTWTLEVQDISGKVIGTINSWSLTFIGDNAATVQTPLVYTPEFASITTAARDVVMPGTSTTIDLIALPNVTAINLNGGAGLIDGINVSVGAGLKNANADGSTGTVTLTGLTQGGSELSGGDSVSTLIGSGADTINAGLGTTTIKTGAGGSTVTLSSLAASTVSVSSGGGDTIYAGLATASVTVTGSRGDTIYDQSARLSFINGNGASVLNTGTGIVTVQAGNGGGTYYAGSGGGSVLTAGSGVVTFYGEASGDVLTAAGTGADKLIAGAGTETLSGGASTGSITIQAGSGTNTLTAGRGKTTFIVGKGSSNINTGGTNDIIQIQSGQSGGLDMITGFRLGTDDLHLINFAPTAETNAINGQKSDGHGGIMLTFTDNTRIDLVGITKVTTSYFA